MQRPLLAIALLCFTILASAQVNVTTYHYDDARTGQNPQETRLTPANVNVEQFGKLFTVSVQGYVYAQPLYLANVQNIAGGTHNVLFVATEHDQLYALDADTGALLWQQSFIDPPSINTVTSQEVNCNDIVPEIGITGTPVIDQSTGTIYLIAKTNESGVYFQRLHAIDIATHAEKFGAPIVVSATVNGENFDPLRNHNRPGLLLNNGHIVIAWASHCDNGPYHGWVMSYRAGVQSTDTLSQEAVFNGSPDGGLSGIWMSGDGVAADSNGDLYFATGNGTYDGLQYGDFGDSIVKVSPPPMGHSTFSTGSRPGISKASANPTKIWAREDCSCCQTSPKVLPINNCLCSKAKKERFFWSTETIWASSAPVASTSIRRSCRRSPELRKAFGAHRLIGMEICTGVPATTTEIPTFSAHSRSMRTAVGCFRPHRHPRPRNPLLSVRPLPSFLRTETPMASCG